MPNLTLTISLFIDSMKASLLIMAVVLVACSTKQLTREAGAEDSTPKLPVYLALGYNLLKGNPLSNMVDTGFTNPIFKISYDQGQIT